MEQLLDMEELKKLTPEQQSQVLTGIKQQAALVNAQNLMTALSEKCTSKCITAPGSSLSGSEKQCMQRCMDRFVESWNVVSMALQQRLQMESLSGRSGTTLGSSSSSALGMFSGNNEESTDFGTTPSFS